MAGLHLPQPRRVAPRRCATSSATSSSTGTRFDFSTLRRAKRIEYDVKANWKFIAENYSECYHCPGVHPQLNKLTPYDLGGDFDPNGAWQGGWMELADGAETMALDGGHGVARTAGRRCAGSPARRALRLLLRRVADDLPVDPPGLPARPPARAGRPGPDDRHLRLAVRGRDDGRPGFDPSDEVAFWDLTNSQDWHVCELQQRGTRSSSWVAGRYSNAEASVHAFDQMVADRYVGEASSWSKRIVRERYDQPAPKGSDRGPSADAEANRGAKDRSAARAKATAPDQPRPPALRPAFRRR